MRLLNNLELKNKGINTDNTKKIKVNPIQIGRILNIPTTQYRNEYDYPYNEYMGPIIAGRR